MIMFRRTHRRLAGELLRIADDRKRELRDLQTENLRLQVALPLVRQALAKAEHDAQYWRVRAEKFIDQIGLRDRILATPTMTDEPPAPTTSMDSVFSALGVGEIHRDTTPPASAAHAAPAVTGVDADAAHTAVAELLARTSA